MKQKIFLQTVTISCLLIVPITRSFAQGKVKTVEIGSQEWMAENVDVGKFRNGNLIFEARTEKDWTDCINQKRPAWCYYNNDPQNGKKYGRLYNWYAVKDTRSICPKGFHVPTDSEWTVLSNYLGGDGIAGKMLKSTEGWLHNGDGDNSSGFTFLPGGNRNNDGTFSGIGRYGDAWTSTDSAGAGTWYRYMTSLNTSGLKDEYDGAVHRNNGNVGYGSSCRCVANKIE